MDVEQPPPGSPAPRRIETVRPGDSTGAIFPVIAAVILAGIVLGTFQIANTSVGWHVATGRWILENRSIVRADPFSFTSHQAPWINHEWLFQLTAALAHGLGEAPGLVVLRALAVAALASLLLAIGLRSGLSPPVAMLLSLVCVIGARPRFFVRPELVSLLVVPGAVWLYLTREERHHARWLVVLAAITVVGANSHAGVLSVPILLGGMLAAQSAEMLLRRKWSNPTFFSGLAAVVVVVLALLVNPYGWRLFEVPVKLVHLVNQPHIPNPEWAIPSFAQTPSLFIAVIIAGAILAARERRAARWALFLMACLLAFRYIRNLGLFFVLLPALVGPALASWPPLSQGGHRGIGRRRTLAVAAFVLAAVLVAAVVAAPWPRFGAKYADGYYPTEACDFLDREGLPASQLYNDVRFGGYLIERYAPSRLVFQDDRNEIHAALLEEIWHILRSSDVRGWSNLLERYDCDTALVRYHAPIRTAPSDGRGVGIRGFSALWFPSRSWALVYWDDVAMVFVRRAGADPDFLKDFEYRILRPDDLEHLKWRASQEPDLRQPALEEARRAVASSSHNRRAEEITAMLANPPTAPLTGP